MQPKPRARRPAPHRFARPAFAALIAALSLDAAAAPLTLPDALTRAGAFDPTYPAAEARLRAADAAVRQAAVRPNPVLGLDLENFAGGGGHQAFDRSEATIYYQETWERGGKRDARTDVARSERDLAAAQAKARRLDLFAEVQTAWVEALAAEAEVAIAEERIAVAERLERDVARRVAAARDPLFVGERARTALARARIDLDQARDAAQRARVGLAAYWGGEPDFDLDGTALARLDLGATELRDDTVDMALLSAQRDVAAARIRLEQARGVQDPSWRAGVRRFGDGGDVAVVIGGAIPLGLRDTNRGNVERAQAERNVAEADLLAARVLRQREAARLLARQSAAASEARRIESEVLPSAERAVAQVQDGFDRGGGAFTYLEFAEAQRAVLDAKARRLGLLRSFHLDAVRLDRLSGRHAPLLSSAETR